MFERIREMFSSSIPAMAYPEKSQELGIIENMSTGSVDEAANNTSSIANFLIGLCDFENLNERDIYEQLFVWEPEVAAVVTKVAEMARSSFKYFMLINDSAFDNIPDVELVDKESYSGELDEDLRNLISTSKLRNEMLDTANEISRLIDVPGIIETWASVLYLHGEVYLKKDGLSLSILPNNRITILDNEDRIMANVNPNTLITEENVLVMDERRPTMTIIKKPNFVHLKLNDVPINIRDIKNRQTFGIYALSPLHRAITAIWMKRQIYIIRTLWSYGNLPREHHIIDANAFNAALYSGTPEQKRRKSNRALVNYIRGYAENLTKKAPDQSHVTSSNIRIENIEHAGNAFMSDEAFLKQLDNSIWDALGMPPSIIRGLSDGSYASELIIASGASLRVEQIARRIGKVILDNMRERLLQINPEYPVNHLDIKIAFEIASSRLETLKVGQLMKDIGLYTPTEIREESEHSPLTDQQISDDGLVTSGNTSIVHSIEELSPEKQSELKSKNSVNANFGGIKGVRSNGTTQNPTTPRSASTQPTDSGNALSKNVLDDD